MFFTFSSSYVFSLFYCVVANRSEPLVGNHNCDIQNFTQNVNVRSVLVGINIGLFLRLTAKFFCEIFKLISLSV